MTLHVVLIAETGGRHEQEENAFSDRYNSSLFVSIRFTLNWRRDVNTRPLANMCAHTCIVFTWAMLIDAPLRTACIVRKVFINWGSFFLKDFFERFITVRPLAKSVDTVSNQT